MMDAHRLRTQLLDSPVVYKGHKPVAAIVDIGLLECATKMLVEQENLEIPDVLIDRVARWEYVVGKLGWESDLDPLREARRP